jgi:hypothetical protein
MPLKVDQVITNSLSVNGVDVNKNTKHYELDITGSSFPYIVTVDTTFGIIDIINIGGSAPASAFTSDLTFYINNPALDLTVIDNVYVQFSVYYNQTNDDNAIPYLISTGGSPTGLEFKLYNANPATEGADNFQSPLYVYFELYTIN